MQDSSIKTTEGIELYLSEIDQLCDEYVNGLDDPESITKGTTFMGLLKFLYVHLFRPTKTMRYNANSILVDQPASVYSGLWDKFCEICYRYGNTPTILKFSTLTGLDRKSFEQWKTGKWRNASDDYILTAKKMYQESESALEAKAVEGNGIGAIFALKSNFQWRETAPLQGELETRPQIDSPEEIMRRHASATLEMPEPPDLD